MPAALITLALGATASATLVIVAVYYGSCNLVNVRYLEACSHGQTKRRVRARPTPGTRTRAARTPWTSWKSRPSSPEALAG